MAAILTGSAEHLGMSSPTRDPRDCWGNGTSQGPGIQAGTTQLTDAIPIRLSGRLSAVVGTADGRAEVAQRAKLLLQALGNLWGWLRALVEPVPPLLLIQQPLRY